MVSQSGLGVVKVYLFKNKYIYIYIYTFIQNHSMYPIVWGPIGCLFGITINVIFKRWGDYPG